MLYLGVILIIRKGFTYFSIKAYNNIDLEHFSQQLLEKDEKDVFNPSAWIIESLGGLIILTQ